VISLQWGPVDPKFQVEGVTPPNHSSHKTRLKTPTNHSSHKTRLNDLSYGIKIWTDLSSVMSQLMHLTDKQTNRQKDVRTERILIARPHLDFAEAREKKYKPQSCMSQPTGAD